MAIHPVSNQHPYPVQTGPQNTAPQSKPTNNHTAHQPDSYVPQGKQDHYAPSYGPNAPQAEAPSAVPEQDAKSHPAMQYIRDYYSDGLKKDIIMYYDAVEAIKNSESYKKALENIENGINLFDPKNLNDDYNGGRYIYIPEGEEDWPSYIISDGQILIRRGDSCYIHHGAVNEEFSYIDPSVKPPSRAEIEAREAREAEVEEEAEQAGQSGKKPGHNWTEKGLSRSQLEELFAKMKGDTPDWLKMLQQFGNEDDKPNWVVSMLSAKADETGQAAKDAAPIK